MTKSAQLIVVLGSGGVGKTTTSASLALALAETGLNAAVITVDPAHRLAQALGLEKLTNDPQVIAEFPSGGKVSALWLDATAALENLIRRHGSKIENLEKILNNRLLQIIQNQLGGIEEYMGVEKVLSLKNDYDFDVIILDTPPSRHALDFLDSPRHLLRFFDESVLKFFVEEKSDSKPNFLRRLLRTGRDHALEVFHNFLGASFLGELAELLQKLRPIHKVFTRTAEGIEQWVRQADTQFVLVSLLEDYSLDEARLLDVELSSRDLPAANLLILNRSLPKEPPSPAQLSSQLGAAGASYLGRLCEQQNALRANLIKIVPGAHAICELPRYSVKHLDRATLLELGRKVVQQWKTQRPKTFSKS